MKSPAGSAIVSLWWGFLIVIALVNISAWTLALRRFLKKGGATPAGSFSWRWWQVLLSGGYVMGCAFRSFLPRVDVQRICLYDSWLSSVFLGRTVATIAELCFVAQWALMLFEFGEKAKNKQVVFTARLLVPLIAIAEICSWYAVLTENFLGHVIEESLWAVTASLATVALGMLWPKFDLTAKKTLAAVIAFGVFYVLFMGLVDVPMYLSRWRADEIAGKAYLPLHQGFMDALFRRRVTFRWSDWKPEIPWMTLYFSLAVWTSIAFIKAPQLATSDETASSSSIQ